MASDGKDKIRAMLPTQLAPEVHSGNLQNLGLIRILDYTCNALPPKNDKEIPCILRLEWPNLGNCSLIRRFPRFLTCAIYTAGP